MKQAVQFQSLFLFLSTTTKNKKSSLKILPSTSIDHQKRAKNIGKKFFKILLLLLTLVHLEAITEVSSSTIIIRLYNMTFFYNRGLFLDTSSVQEPSFVIKLTLLPILGIECIVSKLLQYILNNKRYFYCQFVSTLHLIDFFGTIVMI